MDRAPGPSGREAIIRHCLHQASQAFGLGIRSNSSYPPPSLTSSWTTLTMSPPELPVPSLVLQHITCSPAQAFTPAAPSAWRAFPMLFTGLLMGSLTAYGFCLAVTSSKRTSLSAQVKCHTHLPYHSPAPLFSSQYLSQLTRDTSIGGFIVYLLRNACSMRAGPVFTPVSPESSQTLAPEHVAQ